MPRRKADVPDQPWVDPVGKIKRKTKGGEMRGSTTMTPTGMQAPLRYMESRGLSRGDISVRITIECHADDQNIWDHDDCFGIIRQIMDNVRPPLARLIDIAAPCSDGVSEDGK